MKIYVDLDSTLTDTIYVWLNKINKHFNTNYLPKDIPYYFYLLDTHGPECEFWREESFYDDVCPLYKSQWFIDELKIRYGDENIFIATWSDGNGVEIAKNKLINYYYNIPTKNIIHSGEKYRYTSDGILIDDHKHHIIEHIKVSNNYGILFNNNFSYGWNILTENEKHELLVELPKYKDILLFLDSL